MRLILLAAEQSEQRGLGHTDDLETNSGNISHSVTGTTETGNEHLIVLIDEVQATITRDEGGDLLSVLDQLHTDALTNGRVGLLGLDSPTHKPIQAKHLHLLKNNSLGHGGSSKDVSLDGRHVVSLLVSLYASIVKNGRITLSAHLSLRRWTRSLRAARIPQGFL